MIKTLIYYKPEYSDLARNLRENYLAHDHEKVDIISEEEQVSYIRGVLQRSVIVLV